jgi:hypothetical protein
MKTNSRYLPLLFLAIIFLIPFGFNRYFIRLFGSGESSSIIHFHTALMCIWCALLLLQPLLIINKKNKLHRTLGNLSVILMPVMLVAMYLTIGVTMKRGAPEIIAPFIFMPFFHMLIFGWFYFMAMSKKSKREVHLRYIVISSLTLLGPTIGRINFGVLSDIKGGLELVTMELILLTFLINDYYKKRNIKPFSIGLAAYLTVHIGSLTIANTKAWENIAVLLFPTV